MVRESVANAKGLINAETNDNYIFNFFCNFVVIKSYAFERVRWTKIDKIGYIVQRFLAGHCRGFSVKRDLTADG